MFNQVLPHNDVAIRILRAADALMARDGMQKLSTHKIAKEAGVSVGTIYLYFKDKEDLLNQLVLYLFNEFHTCLKKIEPEQSLFDYYRQLWRASWAFMQANPNIVRNMHQYESLPTFQTMVLSCMNSQEMIWNQFILRGQAEGVISQLPAYVLMAMSMKVSRELMYLQLLHNVHQPDDVIEEVISRTWKAIII